MVLLYFTVVFQWFRPQNSRNVTYIMVWAKKKTKKPKKPEKPISPKKQIFPNPPDGFVLSSAHELRWGTQLIRSCEKLSSWADVRSAVDELTWGSSPWSTALREELMSELLTRAPHESSSWELLMRARRESVRRDWKNLFFLWNWFFVLFWFFFSPNHYIRNVS